MQLISTVRIKRVPESEFFNLKSPGSAGSNFSLKVLNHSGWVKSPVPKILIPFIFAHLSRFSKSIWGEVAREYFECI